MGLLSNRLELENYTRAFYFGCSFTRYYYPTWADLVSLEIPESYQYAQIGAGNFFIYQSIIEAVVKHKIRSGDLVMVMFSNVTREDRYIKHQGWITPGNLFSQDIYNDEFLKKFFCERGYLIRDLALVEGIDRVLASTNADYTLMSMINFDSFNSSKERMNDVDDILDFYKPTLDKVHPSVFEVIFNNDWNTRQDRPKYYTHWAKDLYVDNHPTPNEHLEYLQRTFSRTTFSDNMKYRAQCWTDLALKSKTFSELENRFFNVIKNVENRL